MKKVPTYTKKKCPNGSQIRAQKCKKCQQWQKVPKSANIVSKRASPSAHKGQFSEIIETRLLRN